MGYNTQYNGTIYISEVGKKYLDAVYEMWKDTFEYDFTEEAEEGRINVGECWRDYDSEMLQFCQMIALIDPKAHGEIEAEGEDGGDVWKIEIKDGKAIERMAIITYEEGDVYESLDIKKQVYEMTGREDLAKEIVIGELKNENN